MSEPFTLPYDGVSPVLASPPAHVGHDACVLGKVTLGRRAWLGARSVIRADGHYVRIGDDFRLGARGTVHIAHEVYPTHIGAGVTAGPNCCIHACDVGDRCHLGRDVVILDGSKVAADCAFADGAVVFPRSILEAGWLYEGSPAKPVRKLEAGELEALHTASRGEAEDGAEAEPWLPRISAGGHFFAAHSARLKGGIAASPETGVWFGCDLDAGASEIRIGESANIQDNTTIRALRRPVSIGRKTTIGHNVLMSDCTIGAHSLIGIGATVAPGTTIGDDVLLAAGARTQEGQILEAGFMYGGSPARRIAPLDDKKRLLMASIWPVYCEYARRFAKAQEERAGVAATGRAAR
jgi:carbonic anhydrase/acetyltransferase-like protein (isoleucine patch superfamily)